MQSKRKEELLEFCRQLGITMNNLDILNTALTHTSYAHEAKEQPRPEHIFGRFCFKYYRQHLYVQKLSKT